MLIYIKRDHFYLRPRNVTVLLAQNIGSMVAAFFLGLCISLYRIIDNIKIFDCNKIHTCDPIIHVDCISLVFFSLTLVSLFLCFCGAGKYVSKIILPSINIC